MDGLLALALSGTGNRDGATATFPQPLEPLAAELSNMPVERKLLLLAGSAAVYRQAGYAVPAAPAKLASAPNEVWPACSPGAARLVERLLNGQQEAVLLESLDRLQSCHQRLPYALLPQALNVQAPRVRAAVATVVGRRGEWLSRLNPAWTWLAETLVDSTVEAPDQLRALWEDGTPDQRLAVIRRLRTEKPAEARQWIAEVWRMERADYRVELLQALTHGLSADDEAFPDSVLDDRSATVREQAARLLGCIPGSAYVRRMAERGDAMLDRVLQGSVDGAFTASTEPDDTSTSAAWQIVARPPQVLDDGWTRDGITRKPPPGMGERGWWLTQVLALVPLVHWEARFAATPAALIAAIDGHDWTLPILHGWARAAIAQKSRHWAATLWDRLSQEEPANESSPAAALGRALLPVMQQEDAERRATEVLEAGGDANVTGVRWVHTLQALPQPWSVPFGDTYLALLRQSVASVATEGTASAGPWRMTLPIAAVALPPNCFSGALQAVTIPAGDPDHSDRYRTQLEVFRETIDIRRQLREEIT